MQKSARFGIFGAKPNTRYNVMDTYSISEFRAKASEILGNLEEGQEIVMTRRGKPFGRLTAAKPPIDRKRSLKALKGSMASLPDASYQDFLDAKAIWNSRTLG